MFSKDTVDRQAARVIAKFGNCGDVVKALSLLPDKAQHRNVQAVYKWTWSRKRMGTGGIIPNGMIPAIREAGRLYGVLINKDDLYG